ncbi:hypothetical protein Agub_g8549, partial [Astrephomene gubernaculifera]
TAPVPASKPKDTSAEPLGVCQRQLQQQPSQRPEYCNKHTQNITVNVPKLSALVEEDEEDCREGVGAVDSGGAGGQMRAASPISPFVLQEMQRNAADADSDRLRENWGFAPGNDDTLRCNFGHVVMGETTYNHVYGPGTGQITRAFESQPPGHAHSNVPLVLATRQLQPPGPLPQTSFADTTGKLLEDDQT